MNIIIRFAVRLFVLECLLIGLAWSQPCTIIDLPESVAVFGGDEILTNGDFENGLTGWVANGAVFLATGDVFAGQNSVAVGPSGSSASVSQTFLLPGSPCFLELTAKGYAEIGGNGDAAKSCVKVYDASDAQIAELAAFQSAGEYKRYLFDISSLAGRSVKLALEAVPDGQLRGAILADNIRVIHNPVVFASPNSQYHLNAFLDGQPLIAGTTRARWDNNHVFMYASFTAPPSLEGAHVLEYWSITGSGSAEGSNAHYVNVDATPPLSMVVSDSPTDNAGGVDIALNGGFEAQVSGSGVLDWLLSGSAIRDTDVRLSGAAALCLGRNGASGGASQQLSLDANPQQILSFNYLIADAGGGSGITLSFRDSDNRTLLTLPAFTNAQTWQKATVAIGALRSRTIRFVFSVTKATGAAPLVYVDDVSLFRGGVLNVGAAPLRLLGYDSGAGVLRTEHTIPSGWSTATSVSPLGFLQSVFYRSVDWTGHVEATNTLNYWADVSAPVGSIQINSGAGTTTSSAVTLQLGASDAQSSVSYMRIRADDGVWGGWMPYASILPHTFATINAGLKTICVQYRDKYGNDSAIMCATIDYNTEPIPLGLAKQSAPGSSVRLENCVVTAVFPSQTGGLFAVTQNRASGILVQTMGQLPSIGQTIGFTGQLQLIGAELQLAVTQWTPEGFFSVEPLYLRTGWVGGAAFGAQSASAGGRGLNTIGQFVEIMGRVTGKNTGLFWVDDGSGVVFGTEPPGIGIIVDSESSAPPTGSFVRVRGICRLIDGAGTFTPRIQPRSESDIWPDGS